MSCNEDEILNIIDNVKVLLSQIVILLVINNRRETEKAWKYSVYICKTYSFLLSCI